MQSFTNNNITIATTADIPALRNLLNSAYRGETSKQGWTTEADLIEGDECTNEHLLLQVLQQTGSVILKYTNAGTLIGCLNLQQHGQRVYLGMFSVSPKLQGAGIGKELLLAAEEYARHIKCNCIYMSVIAVRSELIYWYKRHGYIDTGERKPFVEDAFSGRHMQPLEFMILEKLLT